jgi:hypothetical protein
MEVRMRIPLSVTAIVIALAWPATAPAYSKKSKSRSAPIGYQGDVSYRVPGSRTSAGTPCVGYTWRGCLGWDPDPTIRAMIDRDRGKR